MYDLVIIGAGPGGYVAAIRAGQLGLKTAVIEKQYIGGMCLNWGCIPTKALLESSKFYRKLKSADKFGIGGFDVNSLEFDWQKAVKRTGPVIKKLTKGVEYLLKKNNIEIIKGEAEIVSPEEVRVGNRRLEFKNLIIATGSRPAPLAGFPADKVVEIENLMTLKTIPEKILLIGQGPVTAELAQMFSLIDRQVTVISPQADFLPGLDKSLSEFLLKKFRKEKIELITDGDYKYKNGKVIVSDQEIEADLIINSQWRLPILPPGKLKFEKNGDFLEVNRDLQTNYSQIYAVGDVNGLSYLAHSASSQGLHAVNHMMGINRELNLKSHPLNIYTYPELAQTGLTESDLVDRKIDYGIGEFSLSANGKALAEGENEGFVRILYEKKYGEVLGVQIAAPHATDMIAEAAALMDIEATVYDVARTVHAHPTTAEVFMEAGFDAAGEPVHK